jgi:hypothetical protein
MTRDDEALLRFEEMHPRNDGAKHEAMRRQLGLTPVRYQQRLLRAIRSPEAVACYPQTVHRVERRRDAAAASRAARSF